MRLLLLLAWLATQIHSSHGNEPHPAAHQAVLVPKPHNVRTQNLLEISTNVGVFLRIDFTDNPGSESNPKIINLNEIQVFNAGQQLPQLSSVVSSTLGSKWDSTFLFDRRLSTGGSWDGFYHSADANPWLYVNLTNKAFDKIIVYNRDDCCHDRIVGATISLTSDQAGLKPMWKSSFGYQQVYTFYPVSSPLESQDGDVLCAFYNTMPAGGKAKLTNWCGTKSGGNYINGPCTGTAGAWKGVTCAVVGGVGRVTRLDTCQYDNGCTLLTDLGGSLPSSIGGLDALILLRLTFSALSGSIPSSLGGLTGLTLLGLDGNSLTGSIPSSLGALTGLSQLAFGINSLSGSIPSSIGALTGLRQLYLNGNSLTGGVPASFCSLQPSISLHVNTNPGLTCYPPCLAADPNFLKDTTLRGCGDEQALCAFYNAVSNKNFLGNWCGAGDASTVCGSGSSSSWTGVMCTAGVVTHLDITNTLTMGGIIPTIIGGLTGLTTLSLQGDSLRGTIPHQIGQLTRLVNLLLDYNHLSGPLAPFIGALSSLHGLANLCIGPNRLSGTIPSSLGSFTSLNYICINGNGLISGPVPTQLGLCSNLVGLQLDSNSLSGSIPSSLGGLTGLTDLRLHDNALTGPVPASFCSLKPSINLQVQGNPGLTCYPSCLSTFAGFVKDASLVSCVTALPVSYYPSSFYPNGFALAAAPNLIGVLALPAAFTVSLDLMCTVAGSGWRNVLLLSSVGWGPSNEGEIMGIFLSDPNDARAAGSAPASIFVDSYWPTEAFISTPAARALPLNAWSSVVVAVDLNNKLMSLTLLGAVATIALPLPSQTSWASTRLHSNLGRPNFAAASIRNIVISPSAGIPVVVSPLPVSYYPVASFPSGSAISQGNLMGYVSLPSAYVLSFDAIFTASIPICANLVHLTANGDNGGNGNRIPGVWLCPYYGAWYTFGNGGDRDNLLQAGPASQMPINTWVTTTISVDLAGGTLTMSVSTSSGALFPTASTPIYPTQTAWPRVMCYASDPWHHYIAANIRNLQIGLPAKCAVGSYSLAGTAPCTPCSSGYYASSIGQTACKDVTAGWYATAGGVSVTSGATDQKICPAGTYSLAAAFLCHSCPTGWYQQNAGATECLLVSAGGFATGPGGGGVTNSATGFDVCPLGSSSKAGASSCYACPGGYFSSAQWQACGQCQAGAFPSVDGATAVSSGATQCVSCAAGTNSNVGDTVCTSPTGQPSSQPSRQPSRQPTSMPTDRPTSRPSIPTGQPTGEPSLQPTSQPTCPTGQPTRRPTDRPTTAPTFAPVTNADCLPLLQALRRAYYFNSGEYQCPDGSLSSSHVQCIEVYSEVTFAPLIGFSIEFPALSGSRVGRGGACIDFKTREVVCYDKLPTWGLLVAAVQLDASANVKVRCMQSIDAAVGAEGGNAYCALQLYPLFFSAWPETCIETNYKTDMATSTVNNVTTLHQLSTNELTEGFSLRLGKAGLGCCGSFFRYISRPRYSVTHRGHISDLAAGRAGGLLSLDSAYSYTLGTITLWSIVAACISAAIVYFIATGLVDAKGDPILFSLRIVRWNLVKGRKYISVLGSIRGRQAYIDKRNKAAAQ